MPFAERLPVVRIPKLVHVATMGHDVINHGGLIGTARLGALMTHRSEERGPSLLPFATIPASRCRASVTIALRACLSGSRVMVSG